nr:MAG TPA: hypothetical protein [Caudoviricetes sp.]
MFAKSIHNVAKYRKITKITKFVLDCSTYLK